MEFSELVRVFGQAAQTARVIWRYLLTYLLPIVTNCDIGYRDSLMRLGGEACGWVYWTNMKFLCSRISFESAHHIWSRPCRGAKCFCGFVCFLAASILLLAVSLFSPVALLFWWALYGLLGSVAKGPRFWLQNIKSAENIFVFSVKLTYCG
jgi:membrane glycosyltransferase